MLRVYHSHCGKSSILLLFNKNRARFTHALQSKSSQQVRRLCRIYPNHARTHLLSRDRLRALLQHRSETSRLFLALCTENRNRAVQSRNSFPKDDCSNRRHAPHIHTFRRFRVKVVLLLYKVSPCRQLLPGQRNFPSCPRRRALHHSRSKAVTLFQQCTCNISRLFPRRHRQSLCRQGTLLHCRYNIQGGLRCTFLPHHSNRYILS